LCFFVVPQFGNALQQMLTKGQYSEITGQKNIELDASHVASNVMKNFAMQPNLIKDISLHYQTEELLSDEQITNLLKSKIAL